ncbi:hypothetical protein A1O1_03416 [Capronia coronata CBS 617.96]|uniref:Glutathione S-transferase n=1 Tax=Capronia coronata CBS 617.96 TaxID=1182541 RepID=W9YBT3_9EURO|nr:uncharacterized protein A1O1_03416 [Capronia coronata CBS 617.96]EXJ90317.1 hypothetical protein A1O1_03416 [Capronia coronata CBS 617.96]
MITIHHLQRSQSERVLWLCEELSLPYEVKYYKRDPLLSPPDLKALTPLGAAPVIEDSTATSTSTSSSSSSPKLLLSESSAIVEYIIHRHGQGRLALPPTHPAYADYLYWFHMANATLQPAIMRAFTLRLLRLPADNPVKQGADARFTKVLAMLNDRLARVPWLAGDEFTAADIMSVFQLSTMRLFFPYSLTEYPGIVAWLDRVGKRPAYRAAMEKGDPGFEPLLGAEAPEPVPGLY